MRFMAVDDFNLKLESNPRDVVRMVYRTYFFLTMSEVVDSRGCCVLAVSQGLDGMICMVGENDFYSNTLDPIGACRQRCGIDGKLKEVVKLCGLLVFVYGMSR